MFKNIVNFLVGSSHTTYPKMTRRQRAIDDYLSKSTDLCDLERRQRELDRKGWVL